MSLKLCFNLFIDETQIILYLLYSCIFSGGFRVGGARGKTKKGGPLMTSA